MKVSIYGRPNCPNCDLAKRLCDRKGVAYDYKVVGEDVTKEQLEEMVGAPVASVPQIFITNDGFTEYVGNFQQLMKKI